LKLIQARLSVDVFSLNQLSVNESISWQEYSAEIIFNINQLNNNINDKIGSLMTQFSLHQLITEPTYVTEHSSSLLDLLQLYLRRYVQTKSPSQHL
jgi:hypothetical protein